MKNTITIICLLIVSWANASESEQLSQNRKRIVKLTFKENERKNAAKRKIVLKKSRPGIIRDALNSETNESELEVLVVSPKSNFANPQKFIGPPEPPASATEAFPSRDIASEKSESGLLSKTQKRISKKSLNLFKLQIESEISEELKDPGL